MTPERLDEINNGDKPRQRELRALTRDLRRAATRTPPSDESLRRILRGMLVQALGDLSEDCWCASWLIGTEIDVLDLLEGRMTGWGMLDRENMVPALVKIARIVEQLGEWPAIGDGGCFVEEGFLPFNAALRPTLVAQFKKRWPGEAACRPGLSGDTAVPE